MRKNLLQKDTLQENDGELAAGSTPLHWAVSSGELTAVWLLLNFEKYFDENLKN